MYCTCLLGYILVLVLKQRKLLGFFMINLNCSYSFDSSLSATEMLGLDWTGLNWTEMLFSPDFDWRWFTRRTKITANSFHRAHLSKETGANARSQSWLSVLVGGALAWTKGGFGETSFDWPDSWLKIFANLTLVSNRLQTFGKLNLHGFRSVFTSLRNQPADISVKEASVEFVKNLVQDLANDIMGTPSHSSSCQDPARSERQAAQHSSPIVLWTVKP